MKKNQLILEIFKKTVGLMVITSILLPQLALAEATTTITSTIYPVQFTVITTVENTHGGTLTPSDTTIRAYNNGALKDIFAGISTGKIVALDAGTYGVTGNLPPLYTVQLDNCAGNVDEITGPCNVTYRDVPQLKVITTVENTHGGTSTPSDFTIIAYNNGALRYTFPGEGSGKDLALNLGTYGVSGSLPPFYTVQLDNCAGNVNEITGPCNVTYRDVAITSTIYPVHLKVITTVNNDNGGTATSSDFVATVKNNDLESDTFYGTAAGKDTALNAGSYSVESTATSSYIKILSGDCSGTVSSTLNTCTIAYDDVAVELPPVDEKPAPTPQRSSGGGAQFFAPTVQTTGQVLGTSTEPMVLGDTTTCGINLTDYLRMGKNNNPTEVKKLQQFLNEEMKSGLPVTGYFGPLTFNAVKSFQLKYKGDILTPWLAQGMADDNVATGYVYKTTKYMINKISCASLNLTTPKLP